MRSLENWNQQQRRAWADKLKKVTNPELFPNGLECPSCGHGLYDTGQFTPGPPGQLRVKCQNTQCNFKGERYEEVKT